MSRRVLVTNVPVRTFMTVSVDVPDWIPEANVNGVIADLVVAGDYEIEEEVSDIEVDEELIRSGWEFDVQGGG